MIATLGETLPSRPKPPRAPRCAPAACRGLAEGAGAFAGPAAAADPAEPVIGAAVLVSTAFRLRDEPGLVAALRQLVAAVDGFERASSALG